MSALLQAPAGATSPVQTLPTTRGFSLRIKVGVTGKIKGRGTSGGRERHLHRGWRGTREYGLRAAIVRKAESAVTWRCAVYALARLTTLAYPP